MKIENTLKIAFKNILKNKVRSFLTALGIIIGVASVIIMVGVGEGTQKKIEKEIDSLGTNLIMIYPAAMRYGGINQGAGSVNKLTVDDVDKIKAEVKNVMYASPYISNTSQAIANGSNWRTSVDGVSADYQGIKDYKMSSGNFFSESDVKSSKSVAVLGKTIVDNLFPNTDPIGKTIRIDKVPVKVVGVLTSKGSSNNGMDQDDLILIPYTTMMHKISGSKFLRTVYVSATSKNEIDAVQADIKSLLRTAHNLSDNADDDFTIGNQSEIVEKVSSVTKMMTLLLGSIAGVSLFVGGIGIMNIMLVSVTERTREIGTRLAVGARSKDILLQFLIEAFVLSLSGGAIGILISAIISLIVNNFTTTILVINIKIVLIAVLFSGGVGVFFGYYPAKKASELNPIDALRYE